MVIEVGPRDEWQRNVRRVESSDPDTLAELIAHPTQSEDRFLRRYFGEHKYERMRRLARASGSGPRVNRGLLGLFDRPKATPLRRMGGIVVIPGLMGSALTIQGANPDPVWLSYWRIALGRLERLRLASDGESSFTPGDDVRPEGALKQYYGELELALARGWEVRTLAYDWRKDVAIAADALADLIRREFRGRTPVHIVAHSMGGLVARMFIRRHRQLWNDMAGTVEKSGNTQASNHVGRLVMLGTPNHGSHLAVQSLAGLASTVRSLGKLDQRHSIDQIREIVGSFPGLLQLLPSPIRDPKAARFYDPALYKGLGLSLAQRNLDTARKLHETLSEAEDPKRMLYVAGSGELTISGVTRFDNLADPASYLATTQGDGSVTHELGLLRSVPTYYIQEEHSALTSNERVLNALDGLLLEGKTSALSGGIATTRSTKRGTAKQQALELEEIRAQAAEEVESLVQRLHLDQTSRALIYDARGEAVSTKGALDEDPGLESASIQKLEDLIIRGRPSKAPARPTDPSPERVGPPILHDWNIDIGLEYGKIEDQLKSLAVDAPDVLAVGHYLGVRPSGSERALDEALSGPSCPRENRILTQMAQRGIIRGELGQPFFLEGRAEWKATLAIAGMGPPGRCGVPELTVVVRELCWSLGRMGKKRLATVLIGSGKGNLTIEEAVRAWLRGIRQAMEGSSEQDRLESITFIEGDPENALELKRVLASYQNRPVDESSDASGFQFRPFHARSLDRMKHDFQTREATRWDLLLESETLRQEAADPDPVRLSVTRSHRQAQTSTDKSVYLFSALTRTASIPERIVRIDQRLVDEGNERLIGVSELAQQYQYGRYLDELIFPDDLRRHLLPTAPLVIQLDTATARIHWELLAQPRPGDRPEAIGEGPKTQDWPILGITRGLTRQLRSTFAAPPEPAPSTSKRLRVLIVADPSAEHPLPGAEEEGNVLVELFEKYARERWADSGNEIEVKHFIGPDAATRTNVLTEVLLERYDILHFAGHCLFDEKHPELSGWLFSNGEILTAAEISRIDRVPSLVFSNACESGLTIDRKNKPDMCPHFAESFFAQGVSDFICTAWRINDRAALRFAITLYSELLGLDWNETSERQPDDAKFQEAAPKMMHEAMHQARLNLWNDDDGRATWGAYQHYGNPFRRLFAAPEKQTTY